MPITRLYRNHPRWCNPIFVCVFTICAALCFIYLHPASAQELDKDAIGAYSPKDTGQPVLSSSSETETSLAEIPGEGKTPSLAKGKEAPPPFRITSEKFLDYDEESNFIYGRARTKIWYKDVYLEADRVIYDIRLNEVRADGNVILKVKEDKYTADSLWYSLETGEGYAYGAKGRRENIFISCDPKEKDEPTFRLLGQTKKHRPREALFRKSSYTTCDFPVPHYRVSCKEIILYPDDRLFCRDATFYVWEFPVFYLPVYTRSLKEKFPWSVELGYASKLGAYLRIGYDYHHAEYEPSIIKEGKWVKKSGGHLTAHLDFFSKRGIGYGATYKYSFNFAKHKGRIDLYGISDRKFEIEEGSEYTRWIARILHRSELADNLYLQLDIDEMSDPDIYYDLLDRFNTISRERLPERNIRAALTYRQDAYIGRLLFEIRNRIGRDRITNFADPYDNDADFDIDPTRSREVDDYEGFPHSRYGRVSERLPQFTFSTNYLKLGTTPFYTYTDVNVINNLDKGLNTLDVGDDAWVRGIDFYQALLYRWRISPIYTLTARLGAGASYFYRENYDYGYDFPPGTVFPTELDGLTFLDEDTFIVGRRQYDKNGNLLTTPEELADWRTRSLGDVKKYYLYTDLMLRFYARFTDFLHGYVQYDYREGTNDSLGEFYESIGDTLARHDLYNFRLPQHWIRAGLNYFLKYPDITAYVNSGYNLQSEKDIYANEERYFAGIGMAYTNNAKTFRFNTGLRYSGRQEYDPSDPQECTQDYIYGMMNAQYMPLSKMWWTRLSVSGHKALNNEDHTEYSFDEHDTEFNVTGLLGGKIGPKYIMEGGVTYKERVSGNGISDARIIIKRDLHDFIASFMVAMKRDLSKEEYERDKRKGKLEWDYRFNIQIKTPYEKAALGAASIKTLADITKEASVAGAESTLPVFAGD